MAHLDSCDYYGFVQRTHSVDVSGNNKLFYDVLAIFSTLFDTVGVLKLHIGLLKYFSCTS